MGQLFRSRNMTMLEIILSNDCTLVALSVCRCRCLWDTFVGHSLQGSGENAQQQRMGRDGA